MSDSKIPDLSPSCEAPKECVVQNGSGNGTTSSKKKKRSWRPFRIKTGCLVAVRYRPGGVPIQIVDRTGVILSQKYESAFTGSFTEFWVDPVPGRDDGLALVGSWLRLAFPKWVLREEFGSPKRKPTARFVEGEVISVIDFETQITKQAKKRRRRIDPGTLVDMLIDESSLQALPFLERQDPIIDVNALDSKSRRNLKMETAIQGKGKVTVRVRLAGVTGYPATENSKKSSKEAVARWVVRKRVPSKLPAPILSPRRNVYLEEKQEPKVADEGNLVDVKMNTETSPDDPPLSDSARPPVDAPIIENAPMSLPKKRKRTNTTKDATASRYLGDGNDTPTQQEANWRWLARRYNPLELFKEQPISVDYLEQLSCGFAGEVIAVIPTGKKADSLADVIVKRMVLPEHTQNGRRNWHGANSVYADSDADKVVYGIERFEEEDTAVFFKVPIENLVIVFRRISSKSASDEGPAASDEGANDVAILNYSYSLRTNKFESLQPGLAVHMGELEPTEKVGNQCHRCRKASNNQLELTCIEVNENTFCSSCVKDLQVACSRQELKDSNCKLLCDCADCGVLAAENLQEEFDSSTLTFAERISSQHAKIASNGSQARVFEPSRALLKVSSQWDFDLPPEIIPRYVASFTKPVTRIKQISAKALKKASTLSTPLKANKSIPVPQSAKMESSKTQAPMDNQARVDTCARLLSYNPKQRKFDDVSAEVLASSLGHHTYGVQSERPRNLRLLAAEEQRKAEDKSAAAAAKSGRAARASQRRLLRDVASAGVSIDSLAGREQQLRFDRSLIHGWGVFADADIKEGEMIIEYRGEIIGNAMAEKREKEYDEAKLGSDYMFRIDENAVCDATKQGNMARFINASCDPTCTSKIISIDGMDRIAVYAKRDIPSGAELTYDYKFPLEYDESKRIPCFCGSRDCRGFMNWDKRYVALPKPAVKLVENDGNNGASANGSDPSLMKQPGQK